MSEDTGRLTRPESSKRDNSVRDGNTQRLVRIESKLTRLMLHFNLDERGKTVEKLTPCQMHDFDFPNEGERDENI